MKNRIIALFLVSVMLFGFASCDKADDKVVPPKDKDLTVEIQTVDYDDASVNEASERIADITARIVLNYYNKTLTDKEKADIGASFKSDILPSLKDIPVYCDELFELIECAEDYLAVGEENEEEYSTEFIFGLYKRFCKILDGERLGALVYEIEIFNLERIIKEKQAKYDKYQTNFYLEDVKYYKGLLERADTLGRDKFSRAFSVIAFAMSSTAGTVDAETGVVGVTAADMLVILKKQGERFASFGLADSEWQIVAEMCEDFIPTTAKSLNERVLMALGYDDFFIGASTVMPDVIDFYAELTSGLSKENAAVIEQGGALAYERAVCNELLKNKGSLLALLHKIEDELPAAGKNSTSTIKAYDAVGYNAFLEIGSCDAESVIAAIEQFDSDPTEDNLKYAKDKYVAFIAGINPVVAYIYLYK